MKTEIKTGWILAAVVASGALAAGCPAPSECLPGSPSCVDAADDLGSTEAGRDVTDALEDSLDRLDARDGSGAPDAVDGADTPVAQDASDADRTDVMASDAATCPTPGPDAGVCFGRSEVTLPLPGSVCGTLHGASQIPSTSCQSDTGGPEAVFVTQLAARTGLALAVHSALDTVLTVRRDCNDTIHGSEIACNDIQPGVSSALRVVLDAGVYQVVVDQFGATASGGSFVVDAQTYVPATNATCAMADALTLPASRTSELIATGDSTAVACRTTDRGPARFYRATVGVARVLNVQVHPTGAWRAAIHLFSTCGASAACLADATGTSTAPDAAITWTNGGSATTDVFIAVSATAEPVTDTDGYSLQASITP